MSAAGGEHIPTALCMEGVLQGGLVVLIEVCVYWDTSCCTNMRKALSGRIGAGRDVGKFAARCSRCCLLESGGVLGRLGIK